jgi:hypothetical protein
MVTDQNKIEDSPIIAKIQVNLLNRLSQFQELMEIGMK